MCSVGDSFNIDIAADNVALCEYICNKCGKEFKGIALAKVKCPACQSLETTKK